jgi:hypothetical protein
LERGFFALFRVEKAAYKNGKIKKIPFIFLNLEQLLERKRRLGWFWA